MKDIISDKDLSIKQKGFILIELIVVIVIIGILLAITVLSQRLNARLAALNSLQAETQ